MDVYLRSFTLPSREAEEDFWDFSNPKARRTCYTTHYPFGVFRRRAPGTFTFAPITIFYGGNGSGKSTLLNVIAAALEVRRGAVYNRTDFFGDYVSLCAWEGEGKEIRLAVCCRPDCNLIICQDTGPGIPPEIQGRIWDKGVSSKGDGRGFGLYLVSQITRRHNGRIEVDTEQGEGTCFTLTFVKEEETL